jgi:proteasome accessory factor C
VMLPWLMERGSVPLAELAARFDLSEEQVTADLERVAMCGLPPFVDELIDVFIDEGTVVVGVPRLFTRPLRLNSVEAFELLVAARAAMELPGADPEGSLGRGLAKLAAALGDDALDAVTVDLERPSDVERIALAAERHEQLEITYWSAARDELSDRQVMPRRVYADRGNWYVDAHDERSGEVRTFRIDRIESAEPTGRIGDVSDDALPDPGRWFTDPSLTRAVLRLAAPAHWVAERYPVDRVDGPDESGRIEVELPIASERWLERLLLRLGADAEVVAPDHLRDVGSAAASRVLERYRRS